MINLAIIGTGTMGVAHAEAFQSIEGVQLVACCDVDETRAKKFAERFNVPQTFADAEALLTTAGIEAVSIVTPDPTHAALVLMSVDNGKHVLCEKPLATTVNDADLMANAAESASVVNMVNFSYRRASALLAVKKLIQSGELGRIIHFDAYYLQSWLVSNAWGNWREEDTWLWRLSKEHGSGGVLGDVGVHILDFATHCLGGLDWLQCTLRTFEKSPNEQIGPYVLDANDSALITCSTTSGALGTVRMSRWATGHLNSIGITIHGEKGAVRINLDESEEAYEVCVGQAVDDAKWETKKLDPGPSIYERFIRAISGTDSGQPNFRRGAYVQRLLHASFESAQIDDRVSL